MTNISRFPGDMNLPLMDVQKEARGIVIVNLVDIAMRKYLDACLITAAGEDITSRAEKCMGGLFDRRRFNQIHELLATWFRYCRHDLALFPKTQPSRDLEWEWLGFAQKEIRELAEDPSFVRDIAILALEPDSEAAPKAEERLLFSLERRYAPLFTRSESENSEAH